MRGETEGEIFTLTQDVGGEAGLPAAPWGLHGYTWHRHLQLRAAGSGAGGAPSSCVPEPLAAPKSLFLSWRRGLGSTQEGWDPELNQAVWPSPPLGPIRGLEGRQKDRSL